MSWYSENREKAAEYGRQWREKEENREKMRGYRRVYRKRHLWEVRESAARYRDENLDIMRERNRRNRLENPLTCQLSDIKSRARRKGISFDPHMKASDFVVPTHCLILGIELRWHIGKGIGPQPDSPTFDRIDPSLGYFKSNMRIISNRANLLKSNASLAEAEAVLADFRKLARAAQ